MRKPIVESIDKVLNVYNEYVKEHIYTDGIGEHFESMGMDAEYAYILYYYGSRMVKYGKWEKAKKEKWILQKTMTYLKMREDQEYIKIRDGEIEKLKSTEMYNNMSVELKYALINEKIDEIENVQIPIFQQKYFGNKNGKK